MKLTDLKKAMQDMTEDELKELVSGVRNDRMKSKLIKPEKKSASSNLGTKKINQKKVAEDAFSKAFAGMTPKQRAEFLEKLSKK